MKKQWPLVYILVLNYNNYPDTVECLYSLEKLAYDNFKALVIDNNSKDGSLNRIKDSFPDVAVLENPDNYGFAGGNNTGIKYALAQGAEYICLLNNDTVVDPHFLAELVQASYDPQVGVLGPKIYYHGEPTRIWFAGGYINWITGDADHLGLRQPDQGQFDLIREVDYVTGCCLLIKKEVIEKVGLLDENYFLYFEDADWCVRVARAGYKNIYVPQAKLWHKVSATMGGLSPSAYYYLTRNRFYFFHKFQINRGANKAVLALYLRVVKSLGGIILRRPQKLASIKAVIKGVLDYCRGIMGKRQE